MKITIIVSPQLYDAIEPKFCILIFTRLPHWTFFAKHNNRKCVHTTKKCTTDFFLCFRGDFVRIPCYDSKEFSVKKYFSCHPPKAAIRRLRMEMKLYLNIFSREYKRRKIVASRSFHSLVAFYLPLI